MQPQRVLETCLYVDDLPAARRFYQNVLGLELVNQQKGRHVFFRCGEGMLLLFNPRESSRGGDEIPPHGATGSGHVAFAIDQNDLDGWRKRLAAAGVAIEKVVDWPQGGQSLYFRDPAGNSLELTTPSIWGL